MERNLAKSAVVISSSGTPTTAKHMQKVRPAVDIGVTSPYPKPRDSCLFISKYRFNRPLLQYESVRD